MLHLKDTKGAKSIDYTTLVVLLDPENLKITLHSDIESKHGFVDVIGTLSEDAKLNQFKINTNSTFGSKKLAQLMRFNRLLFADPNQMTKIATQLEQLKVKIDAEFEDINDFQGQKRFLFEKKVNVEMDLSFKMIAPIFKGEEKKSFVVNIRFDTSDRNIYFFLESIELNELKTELIETVFNREFQRFSKDVNTIYIS
jgi:hypothetical protein